MAREFSRNERVGDHIQKVLATLIQTSVKDAGLGLVTISAVDLSPDMSHAKIYITFLGSGRGVDFACDSAGVEVVTLLNNDAVQFRHHLAKVLSMRGVPELRFIFDKTLERANYLSDLIDSVRHPLSEHTQSN